MHVEDEGKFTSTLTDSIENTSKHENTILTDQKPYHSDGAKNVESNGATYNGMKIDVR